MDATITFHDAALVGINILTLDLPELQANPGPTLPIWACTAMPPMPINHPPRVEGHSDDPRAIHPPYANAIPSTKWPQRRHRLRPPSRGRTASSEVQSKMIFMGHQISSCRVPVVRSFFIFWRTLSSSWNLSYDHLPLPIYTNIIFQYPKKIPFLPHNSPCDDPISTSPVPKSHIVMSHNSSCYDPISTSSVPKSHIATSHNSSC